MKQRSIISLLLTVCLLVALLSTGAYAADPPANTIAQAYKNVIDSTKIFQYASQYASDGVVSFFDLDGNTVPEMFLWAEGSSGNPTVTGIQVWSFQNGAAKMIGTVPIRMGYTLYVNASGNLVSYCSISSAFFGWFIYIDTYSRDASGNLYLSEKVELTIQEYADTNPPVYLKQPIFSGTVNGQSLSEKEASQLYEAKRQDSLGKQAEILAWTPNERTHAMSKYDAIRFLDGIDVFFDVPGDQYYAEPVKWAIENGITNGTGDYSFSPEQTCTRGHILTFLWRAAGSPEAGISNPFSDIVPSDYYYQAALWAFQNGMVSDSVFAPETPCTRAATVMYIWQSKGSPTAGAAAFSDIPTGAAYSQAVAWAVENKITDGVGNNQFAPDTICSRGQIVTFLYRARNVAGVSNARASLYEKAMSAYHDFVSQKHHEDEWSYDIESFALFDLNADGIPELFTTGGGRMDYHKIFTFDGAAVKCVHWGSEFDLYDNGIVYVAFAGGGEYRLYSYYALNDLTFDLVFQYAEWFGLNGTTYSVGEKAYDENAEKVPHEQIARQLEAILGSAKTVSTQYHKNDAAERLAVFG